MAKTTVLRVKRRRDEAPPPSTFKVTFDTNNNNASNGNDNGTDNGTDNDNGNDSNVHHKRSRYTNNTTIGSSNTTFNANGNANSNIMELTNLMSHSIFMNQQQQQQQQPPISTPYSYGYQQQPQHQQHQQRRQRQQQQHSIVFHKVTKMPTSSSSKKRKASPPPPLSQQQQQQQQQQSQSRYENDVNDHDDARSVEDIQLNVIDAKLSLALNDIVTATATTKNVATMNSIRTSTSASTTSPAPTSQQHGNLNPQGQASSSSAAAAESAARPLKRKKISLHMIDSRTMTEHEFWNDIQSSTSNITAATSHSSSVNTNVSFATTATTTTTTTATTNSIKTKKSSPSKKSNLILDPTTQMMNQNLLSLHPTHNKNHPNNQPSTSNSSNNSNSHGSIHNRNSNSNIYNISSIDPTQRIMSHLELIQTHGSSNLRKYINWQCVSTTTSNNPNNNLNGYTILHMASLLNSTNATEYICTKYSGIIDFDLVDNDGYTARDVAEMVGSEHVAQIISTYMKERSCSLRKCNWGDRNESMSGDEGRSGRGGRNASNSRSHVEEEREEDYVYDLYCLKQEDDNNNGDDDESRVDEGLKKKSVNDSESDVIHGGSTTVDGGQSQCQREGFVFDDDTECDASTRSETLSVSMLGGVGYWNENGELILEAAPHDCETNRSDIDEDEYDSNCEEYEGNDYPEEDADEDEDQSESNANTHYNTYGGRGQTLPQSMKPYDYDTDSDNSIDSNGFRNRAVDLGALNTTYGMHQFQDDDDDIDQDDYSGFMYAAESRWSRERIFAENEAYDSDFDN